MKFRRRDVDVEAMHVNTFDYDELCDIVDWCGGNAIDPEDRDDDPDAVIGFLDKRHSWQVVRHGDWLVKDPNGTFWVCPEVSFEVMFVAVGE